MTSWSHRMDFGVVHPMIFLECRGGAGPILETLPVIINDETFGAVEIAPIKDPAVRRQASALLAQSGLQVVYLAVLPVIIERLELGSADAALRQAAVARLKTLIEEAIDFGAGLAMLQGPLDPGPEQRAATTERLIDDLRQLCDHAAARSRGRLLHLTLENFDRDVEKKRLIGPTAEAVQVAVGVDRPNFGLTLDLSHLPLLGETSAEALAAAAPHLIHAHIGNCVIAHPDSPLYGDFHPRFGHPHGRNDLPEVVDYLRGLDGVGYWGRARQRLGATPILSMELRPAPGEDDPLAVLANGKRTFTRAWALAHA